MNSNWKTWFNGIGIMVLLALLSTVALLTFSPWHFFGLGYPPALKIGILEDNDLLPAIEAAVEDINQSVRKMKPSPPLVRISRISSSASITEEFQRLHDSEGIRVFIATSKKSLDEVKSFVRYRPQYYSEAVIVSLISTSDEDHFQKIATMNLKEEARGYLALIESNNPGNKTLDVVPVWENLPEVAELYEVYKSEIAASYPNSIRFTLPVTYEASKYPRSDGMQAVSEISSRLVLHPNAHIFFLTSSRLTEVIESSSMNKALTMLKSRHGRHWYVRGLVEDEAVLNNLEINAKDFAQQTSLTTLTFMASADTLEAVEMLKRSMNHEVGIVGGSRKQSSSSSTDDESSTRPPSSAQTYLRARAYSIVYGLHKSFTTSILQQKSLKSVLLLRKNPDDNNNNKNEEKSIILASLTFHATRPQILPLNNWIVSNLVSSEATAATIEDGGNGRPNKKFKVEPIYTYPLPRHELQTLMSGLKAQEECARPRIQLWLHPSIIMPHISLGFSDLQSIPEVMVLPAQKGISVTFQCSQRASITAYCMPTKFNRGQMTCRLLAASEADANIGGPPEIAAHSHSAAVTTTRSKREIGGGLRGRFSDFMEDFQENVRPLWSSLTPDVFTCSASVVGCDFCIYYLATYNLTAPPAACIGGCSLSTFSSCSKLVAKSLVQTIELQKTIG